MNIIKAIEQRIFDRDFIEIVGHLGMDPEFLAFASAALADSDES